LFTLDGKLCAADFPDAVPSVRIYCQRRFPSARFVDGAAPRAIGCALERYFEGELDALDEIPVAPRGTSFQARVWDSLRSIRPGHPITYSELAAAVGRPRAVRAVGAANGANPIAIIIPCHRVIGKGGDLRGYAGGLHRKAWLLAHERRFADAAL
jgi:methylated-DNA-[protein]-cysteine S-methyltransferase